MKLYAAAHQCRELHKQVVIFSGLTSNPSPAPAKRCSPTCPNTSSLKNLRSFSNVHWFIMKTVCCAWTHSQQQPSNMEMCGMTKVRGADVGHRSGKGRNEFCGIVVKTTAVGFLAGPDVNFKHMSQEVKNNKKGRTLSNRNVARLCLRSSSVTQTPSMTSVQVKLL